MVPGVETFGAPGWLIPVLGMPVPAPVVVVDELPGADEMPADPGLVVVVPAGGVPTGGMPPCPGARPPCAAPAPVFCADAADVANIMDIAIKAGKCSLCRMKISALNAL
jgi:hypothetical protein